MRKSTSSLSKDMPKGLEPLLKGTRPLILGVTGGIASGKSTVVKLLEKKGCPVIDFDVIAREIVEPGKPAWKDILSYFGERVLREDRTLDREGLSDIIFRDMEKRKKLEGFTHPRINEEFVKRVNEIAAEDSNAIIQVDIPLLIEIGLQHFFHKILVVYAPPEVQIERLVRRDGISREKAADILQAQMPIDEKVGYADFVIRNEGSMEETKRQVDDFWEKIKEVRDKG
jgi:dephospho-CoA kinase